MNYTKNTRNQERIEAAIVAAREKGLWRWASVKDITETCVKHVLLQRGTNLHTTDVDVLSDDVIGAVCDLIIGSETVS